MGVEGEGEKGNSKRAVSFLKRTLKLLHFQDFFLMLSRFVGSSAIPFLKGALPLPQLIWDHYKLSNIFQITEAS